MRPGIELCPPHAYMCTHTRTGTHARTYTSMHAYTHPCTHAHMHAHMPDIYTQPHTQSDLKDAPYR